MPAPDPPRSGASPSLRRQRVLSMALIAVGALLVAVMVVVESEPGGIPLLVLLSGLVWHVAVRVRTRWNDL
ncbi:MAG: hypothetical protein AAGG50_09180 [Bacteroidota bacterium]